MMPPVQAAVISKALDIVRSNEGVELRNSLLENSRYLRKGLTDNGLEVIGTESAVVPVIIGNETSALLANNYLFKSGVSTNMIDFPGVPLGKARFRLQVMATHSKEHIDLAVPRIADAINMAREDSARIMPS